MARFGGVCEAERRDEVLIDVREGDTPILLRDQFADVLYAAVVPACSKGQDCRTCFRGGAGHAPTDSI